MLTTIVVNSLGEGTSPPTLVSLRSAITAANQSATPTTITFDPTVFSAPKTISIDYGMLELQNNNAPISIIGPSVPLTIDFSGSADGTGAFQIDNTASISNLSIKNSTNGALIVFGTLSLTNDVIADNTSYGPRGGAIFAPSGKVTATNCTFLNNTSSPEGSSIVSWDTTLVGCTVSGNVGPGAAVEIIGGGTGTLINDTITGNSSEGIRSIYSHLDLTNVTVSGNQGIGVHPSTFTDGSPPPYAALVGNSIIANNAPDVSGPFASKGNNLIGQVGNTTGWLNSDQLGTSSHPLNPLLSAVGDHGGPTPTMLPVAGSPAIDHGSDALIPSGTTTDQRGLPRIAGSAVDVGAVEVQSAAPATIRGEVFADDNGNKTLDNGELGVSGRKVYIDKNKNNVLDAGEPTFTTGTDGAFSFSGLAAGTYRVRDVLLSGWRRTSPAAGYFDVTVSAGQLVTARNFAETTRDLISGTAFADNNGNAKLDSGEPGVSGRKIYIDKNKNGVLDAGEPVFTTGANGAFTFNGLVAGTYRVRDVLPTGWRRTSPTAGFFDVTVSSGQTVTGKDFAETTRGLISGIVFKDANGNGVKDSTEVGLSGWVVFLDTNNNGKLDVGEQSFTTGSDGKFSFVVPAGTYHLREVLKSGFKRTAPSSGVYAITLSSGQIATGKNFGDR